MTTPLDLAEILRLYGDAYRQKYGPLPIHFERVIRDLTDCRTQALGGHLYACDECGSLVERYNSCGNRCCPRCQALEAAKWLEKRQAEILPVPYFQIVFTVPDNLLNPLFLRNDKELYNLLFRTAASALLEIAADPKHLGARIGFIAILHTWGQKLQLHPHLHCLVPGGGLSPEGQRWIGSSEDFFLPVQVLRRLYRGKFMARLRELSEDRQLEFPESIDPQGSPRAYREFIDRLYSTEWNVYCEAPPPNSTPENILGYLGRYVHRVAISNQRLLRIEEDRIFLRYKDYADGDREKITSLDAIELIRRFFLHVLPPGFHRIRYYGLLANRHRAKNLERCRELLGGNGSEEHDEQREPGDLQEDAPTWQERLLRLTGIDPTRCPVCNVGRLVYVEPIPRQGLEPNTGRAPP